MIEDKPKVKTFLEKYGFKILIFLILLLGIIVRIYNVGEMPNALNVDEASSGYDTFSIMKNGVDRNGNELPVVLYAWGSGQSVLYTLISITFVAILGLNEFSIRIAMAIIGSISLIVIYYLFKNIFENKWISVIALAFLAICPWHIMKSRWGMDCNLFPDLILIGVLLLVLGIKRKKLIWQILSFIVFGISAYSYATSYLFLPVFVCAVLIYLVIKKEISIKKAIGYLGIVFVITLPLIIYLIINTFDLQQFKLLGLTIPRMKENRYEEISTIFSGNLFENCVDNLLSLIRLIFIQNDGLEWNALPEYGMFYLFSIVFFIIGIHAAVKKYNKNQFCQIMNIWMISSIIVAAFCIININRINIIMFPCIYYIVLGLYEICKKYKIIAVGIIILYALNFIYFINDYINQDFNQYLTFESGVEEVVDYCEKSTSENVYCYNSFKEPFIYFMFYSEYDVNNYLDTVQLFNENGVFDNIKSFGKYKFYFPEKYEEGMLLIVPKGFEFDYAKEFSKKVTINQFDIYED